MTLAIHYPYPGVALVVTQHGSAVMGVPTDSFKATKAYCNEHELPFPRILVAPPALLVGAVPQFNPEFFLYDFLFVYGAAFKPELQRERLTLVVDEEQVDEVREALRITLVGPSRSEMRGYVDREGRPLLDTDVVDRLAKVSEHLAIKKADGQPLAVDDMVKFYSFDQQGRVDLLDGNLVLVREGGNRFRVRCGGSQEEVDLSFDVPVVPFATLPVPDAAQTPVLFGVKPLGTRSGFDLSGPATGFVLWINGRAVVYDGPVGTRYLLAQQGMTFDDVGAVVLSHCHEDHMGAFVEMILAGHRPRVLTTEPIYRSALLKLSSCFRQPQDVVAQYLDFNRVTPGQALDLFGASFDFFYTAHAIPTVGVNVTMQHGGKSHSVQISGDTMGHEGLDEMKAAGAVSEEDYIRLRNLVPEKKNETALYLADVGEALIHGHPKDWQGNPNRVVYYHCADSEHTRSFGHDLAVPGKHLTILEAPRLHPSVPGRLLSALRFLDITDPGWFSSLLFSGQTRTFATGDTVSDGSAGNTFSVIVSGTAKVSAGAKDLARLGPGEFFGAIELTDAGNRQPATIEAQTPMEVFEINAELFHDYVREAGLDDVLQQIWTQRPLIESARLFRSLDLPSKNRLARFATAEQYTTGSHIVEQGQLGDDFFLLVSGDVEVASAGKVVAKLGAGDEESFFGAFSAIHPNRPRRVTVRTLTDVEVLRIAGRHVRELFERDMGVRFALNLALEARS